MCLLLEAASAAAMTADAQGRLPLHVAAYGGELEAVHLLLEAAPAAAAVVAKGRLPLEINLDRPRVPPSWLLNPAECLAMPRLLLSATPPEAAFLALETARTWAQPLVADLAARAALSPAQWQRVPASLPALGAASPPCWRAHQPRLRCW